ncbi:hypothetical protein AQJ91_35265 [Streptomyces dysideae]|uniref:Uncharacterized protein n=1 Tax=Streptomyces dysideae TaxID=909626 RepID=A0A117RYZ0_9ACTN|nr:hypothetical protein AQJ91_35265 [Streptomyces dysideae]
MAVLALDVVGEPADHVGGEHPGLVGQVQHLVGLGHPHGGRRAFGVHGGVPRGQGARGRAVERCGAEAGSGRVDEYEQRRAIVRAE